MRQCAQQKEGTEQRMLTFRQVREQDAPPETAAIYSDIKTVSGLPQVNLIWRHFAAFPGILRWAWDTVSPVVASTAMDTARQRIVSSITLPTIAPMGVDGLRSARLSDQARASISAVIDFYMRGNLINIVALTALRMRLEYPDRPAAHLTASTHPAPAPIQLDPLPRIDALDASLAAQIRALSIRHEGLGDGVIPSLYLSLSHWPGLIEALPTWLSSLYEPVAMQAARVGTSKLADAEAEAMLPELIPPPEGISAVQPELERFTRLLIPGAIPVCVALRRLFPKA